MWYIFLTIILLPVTKLIFPTRRWDWIRLHSFTAMVIRLMCFNHHISCLLSTNQRFFLFEREIENEIEHSTLPKAFICTFFLCSSTTSCNEIFDASSSSQNWIKKLCTKKSSKEWNDTKNRSQQSYTPMKDLVEQSTRKVSERRVKINWINSPQRCNDESKATTSSDDYQMRNSEDEQFQWSSGSSTTTENVARRSREFQYFYFATLLSQLSVNETLFFVMFRLIVFSLLSPLVVMISTGPEKESKREGKSEKVSLSFSTFAACWIIKSSLTFSAHYDWRNHLKFPHFLQ